jgi:F0F1-type ATP synthase membrane subunit b/b'
MKDWKFDPNDAKKLNEQIRGTVDSQISQQQMQEMMKQAEQWRDQMKGEVFSLDQKKLDEMKRQMEEFRKDFKPEDLKTDPKLMDDLRKQMEEFMTQVPEFN